MNKKTPEEIRKVVRKAFIATGKTKATLDDHASDLKEIFSKFPKPELRDRDKKIMEFLHGQEVVFTAGDVEDNDFLEDTLYHQGGWEFVKKYDGKKAKVISVKGGYDSLAYADEEVILGLDFEIEFEDGTLFHPVWDEQLTFLTPVAAAMIKELPLISNL